MRLRTLAMLLGPLLSAGCTGTDARSSPAAMPSAHAGEGCSAGLAATATCGFIATLQKEGPAGLFNEELKAAQSGQPLPDAPWRVESCDEGDPAVVTCRVSFASRETTGTFRVVATNAEDADGRLVLLGGVVPTYAVQEYVLS